MAESIVNAQANSKTLRLRSRAKRYPGEKLYVIKGFNYDGTLIYTKGAIVRQVEREILYVFISAKIATLGEQTSCAEGLRLVRVETRSPQTGLGPPAEWTFGNRGRGRRMRGVQ